MLRGLDEELRVRKYAHVERERRFLVEPGRCPPLQDALQILIEDLYIDATRLRLRRMTDASSGRVVLKLSKKYDAADVRARPIVTTYLSDDEYALLGALPGRLIRKRRHALGAFGIDVFEGPLDGLVLAEIECGDEVELAAVATPTWASREVTDEPAYQGGALSELDRASAIRLMAV